MGAAIAKKYSSAEVIILADERDGMFLPLLPSMGSFSIIPYYL